jgi:hypothetical protein
MKNILLVTSLLVFVTNISFAQEENNYQERIVLGIKAGANYSNVYDEKGAEFDADGKLGFTGGAFVAIPIGKFFGIHPEVLISQKGFKSTGTVLGLPYTMTRTTTYIDVPIFFAVKPVSFITLVAGPQFSYLIKKRDQFESSFISTDIKQEFENENVRKNIMSLALGADININHFVLGARVAFDVQKNNGDGTNTTPRYKNVWFQGTIGLRL